MLVYTQAGWTQSGPTLHLGDTQKELAEVALR